MLRRLISILEGRPGADCVPPIIGLVVDNREVVVGKTLTAGV